MSSLTLRSDLEPWDCTTCSKLVYRGQVLKKKFYCVECAPSIELALEALEEDTPVVELEVEAQVEPEVILEVV